MSEENQKPQQPAEQPQVPQLPDDVMQGLRNLISRTGGSEPTNVLLYNDNYELRRENTELKAKVPKEGAVVLSKEDADALAQYRALGELSAIKQGLEERTALQQKVVTAERNQTINDIAKAAQFKPEVLRDLDALKPGLEYELRDDPANKEGGKIPVVKFKGEGDTIIEKPLMEYASQNWAAYLPSLKAEGEAPIRYGTPLSPPPSGAPKGDDNAARNAQSRVSRL